MILNQVGGTPFGDTKMLRIGGAAVRCHETPHDISGQTYGVIPAASTVGAQFDTRRGYAARMDAGQQLQVARQRAGLSLRQLAERAETSHSALAHV